MRSVFVDGLHSVSLHEVPDPVLTGPDGAIVQVETAAICGSDLHFYDGDLPFYPVAVGHEVVGTVVEVGPDVRRFRAGQRVLVSSVAGCGRCVGCATGDPVTCIHGGKVFGAGELGGGQSDLLAVPAADFQLLEVPEGVSDEGALLLTDNLATGWGAVRRDVSPATETVLVLGLGAVGLCAMRSALALGAQTVFVVDPVAGRRERAVAEAPGRVVALEGPLAEVVPSETNGRGVDVVVDAVALDATLDDAFAAVRPGGTVSVVGVHTLEPYPLPILMGLFRSLTLRMTTAPVQSTWPELVPLLQSGALASQGVFTHAFPLEAAAAAYAEVAARNADCLKVQLLTR